MITIGFVEDNSSVRTEITRILSRESEFKVLVKATDGYELLNYLYTQKMLPDVLLVDINIPRIDGIALTDFITDNFPAIKVIGVSSYTENDIVEDLFACGGWGYVFKLALHNIPTAINAVMNNDVYIDPNIDFNGELRAALVSKRLENKSVKKELGITKREGTFISLTATDLEYNEIAQLMFVERKTLDRFFSNISKKIEVKNRHNLVLFSIRHGLTKIARLK